MPSIDVRVDGPNDGTALTRREAGSICSETGSDCAKGRRRVIRERRYDIEVSMSVGLEIWSLRPVTVSLRVPERNARPFSLSRMMNSSLRSGLKSTISDRQNESTQKTYEPFHDTDYDTSTPDHPESAPHENDVKARVDPSKDCFKHRELYTNRQPAQPAEEHAFPLRCSAVLYIALLHETRYKSQKGQQEGQCLGYSQESQGGAAQEFALEFVCTITWSTRLEGHARVNARIIAYTSEISTTPVLYEQNNTNGT